MAAKTVYNYHPQTGEFTGENKARLDPLEGKPMLPASATFAPPPEPQEGFARVFDGGAWKQVEDLRGKTYWLADGSKHKITSLGEALPKGALDEPPRPPIEETKAAAKAEIVDAASAAVLSIGGNPHRDEIGSWPSKVAAAEAALAGQDFDAVILAPTMQDYGVDAKGAAGIIMLRARLYRLAKAAAEMMVNNAKKAIETAKDQETIDAELEGFKVALDERQAQFAELRADAIQGKLAKLEAAEKEVMGG